MNIVKNAVKHWLASWCFRSLLLLGVATGASAEEVHVAVAVNFTSPMEMIAPEKDGRYAKGSYWQVPSKFYPTLKQDAVMLTRGKTNAAAVALLAYVKCDSAKTIISNYGYEF